jgi:hypothetical protein
MSSEVLTVVTIRVSSSWGITPFRKMEAVGGSETSNIYQSARCESQKTVILIKLNLSYCKVCIVLEKCLWFCMGVNLGL